MGLLKWLGAWFKPAPDSHALYYAVRCQRCGEVINVRADLYNELSVEYGENELPAGYFYRKVLIGRGRCFQTVEVTMTFDAQRRLTSRKITGGEFVSPEEAGAAGGA